MILIPCKGLDQGKSRLAPVLDDKARRRLCERLLRHTLFVAIAYAGRHAVRVLSADPLVASVAADREVSVMPCENGGLNGSLNLARDRLIADGHDDSCLILPTDLPYLSVDALGLFPDRGSGVLIATDRRRLGTNALWLSAEIFPLFPFLFGADSLAKHAEAARQADISYRVLVEPELAFDLDTPEDYKKWEADRIGTCPLSDPRPGIATHSLG